MTESAFSGFGRMCMPAAAVLALGGPPAVGAETSPAAAPPSGTVSDSGDAAERTFPELQAYRRHYEEALAAGQYLEAEAAAKRTIDHLIETDQRGYRPMAGALTRLAFAQHQRQLYQPALENYQAAIELLTSGESRLSASLVEPLLAIGETYMASDRPELALAAYRQALHVQHVNYGPHTLEQVDSLDALATALADSGDREAALQAVDRMYYLFARAFSPDSEEVLPSLQRKARLLEQFGRHTAERGVYRDIVRIIQAHRGEHDLSLLEVYSALGRTYFHDLDDVYFRSEPTTETGETFLRKALEVTDENPEATWRMERQALLQLADYYTLRDIQDKARIHYRRAWHLLSDGEERVERRRRDLERLVTLLGADLDPYANFGYRSAHENVDSTDYENGYVVARFTVNERGRVTDVEIADAEPRGFAAMETRVRQAVRDLIYRPRYEDGAPVSTPGQLYRHQFRYRASDLEDGN